MNERPRVILTADLGVFFREEIVEAQSELGIKLDALSEYYLVNLLCEFSRLELTCPTDILETRAGATNSVALLEPLAFIYERAQQVEGIEKQRVLKELGDIALYTAGFFTDYLESTLVDVPYYIMMGGRAYGELAQALTTHRLRLGTVQLYGELSAKFASLVDLLNQVAEKARERSDKQADLLKIYAKWLQTGSKRLARILKERGLLPVATARPHNSSGEC